jgi:hypothetical protein
MVTSALKMRTGEELQLSFAGDVLETVSFYRDARRNQANEEALAGLLGKLGKGKENPELARPGRIMKWEGSCLWERVVPGLVLGFLKEYISHEGNRKVRTELLTSYIEMQNQRGELTEWCVALVGKAGTQRAYAGHSVTPLERALRVGLLVDSGDRYQIRRLLSPRDEGIDLSSEEWLAALELTRRAWHADTGRGQDAEVPAEPGGKQMRAVRPPTRGLLLLYPVCLTDEERSSETITLGIGISFPESPSAPRVTYKVNGIYYDQEFGPDQ